MASKTKNYGLNKHDPTDFYNVEARNENWDKIDDALNAVDPTKVTTKAAPADADGVMIADSAAGGKAKRLLWSSVKTALEQIFGDVRTAVSKHIADKSNPHAVTAEQVGAVRAQTQIIAVPASFDALKALAPGVYGWVSTGNKDWMPTRLLSLSGNIRFELTVKNAGTQNYTYVLRCIDGVANLDEFIGELAYKDGIANASVRWTEIATLKDGPLGAVFRAKHQSIDCEYDTATTYLRDTAFSANEQTPSINGVVVWQYS